MRCPACQTENRPGIRFCERCGTTLGAACAACGASVPAEARFCGACGAPRAWARYVGALVAQRRGDAVGAARHADEAQEIAEELALRPLLERCRAVLRRVA